MRRAASLDNMEQIVVWPHRWDSFHTPALHSRGASAPHLAPNHMWNTLPCAPRCKYPSTYQPKYQVHMNSAGNTWHSTNAEVRCQRIALYCGEKEARRRRRTPGLELDAAGALPTFAFFSLNQSSSYSLPSRPTQKQTLKKVLSFLFLRQEIEKGLRAVYFAADTLEIFPPVVLPVNIGRIFVWSLSFVGEREMRVAFGSIASTEGNVDLGKQNI